jgi:hypothetical protein
MKIKFKLNARSAYALLVVLFMAIVAVIILGGTLNRTYGVARMNSRAVDMMSAQNAAEAALELVFSRMQYDFQSSGGLGMVVTNVTTYRGLTPPNITGHDTYWDNFQFSDGQGNVGRTYVNKIGTITGPLPEAYNGRTTSQAPVYRILSNVKPLKGTSGAIGTAQEDVVLALIPLTAYAIFYNGLLEFSTCATMTVNGAVHSNTNIYVGAGSGATLTFNTTVTASGIVEAPPNNGSSWGTGSQITNYYSGWQTTFNGVTNFINRLASIQVSIPMTNTHSLIDVPLTNNATTVAGQQQLYNQAQVVITVSNVNSSETYTNNPIIIVKIQKAPDSSSVPGADGTPTIIIYTNQYAATFTNYWASSAALATNLPFLTISNLFYDKREGTTNLTTQIDVGLYKQWLVTNTGPVVGKFPVDGSSGYPTILYVNDNRNTSPAGGHKLNAVRIKNGQAPPANGGFGFSVATPDPLYVWGNYNQTDNSLLGTTSTASGTVPCAFMSDAITMLSPLWSDHNSMSSTYSGGSTAWNATNMTVNAAILTGIVPSTGTTASTFSGGVHNLPRLLEDWSGQTLTLNTSIINLFNSDMATGVFVDPGTYYAPPTRQFSYDLNFSDPTKVPPGIPCALVALRYNWTTPPPNNVSYNVTP